MLVAVLLLSGCSSTRFVDSWRDTAYTGRPARMLIMGVAEARGPRLLVEEEFARQLRDRGVETHIGTSVFPGDGLPGKEAVIAKADELQVDAVLVVRFLKKSLGETHTPVKRYATPVGFATSWDEYMGTSMTTTAVGIRDVSYDFTYVLLETTVFDRANRQSVWSALTQTKYQDHPLKKIGPFTTTIMRDLDRAGLLPKR
jgi:hypothetical protein